MRLASLFKRGWSLGIIFAASLSTIASAAERFELQRGIGIAHAMAWAQVEAPPSTAFVFPPFADRALREAELQAVRRAGFDFVRLAVDPGPFLQFQSARHEQLERMLLDTVQRTLASGLGIVVEFHPSDIHPQYFAKALAGGVDAPGFQNFLRLVERTAALLDRLRSARLALELFNEPLGTTEAWQPMLEAAYRAARRHAPGLTLVLTGAREGMPEGLTALRTTVFRNDPAMLYTFHYYEPFQFTHQGAAWNAARYLTDVPYPAHARPLRDSLDATAAVIAAANLTPSQKQAAAAEARRFLESYARSGFDRAAIGRSLDRIAAWAARNGVQSGRIFLGEFGAYKHERQAHGARAAERLQWYADVRREAEARGFAWAVWGYRDAGGFSLTKDDGSLDVDPAIIAALGLTPRPRPASLD